MDIINEYIKNNRLNPSTGTPKWQTKGAECIDGFKISIQASEYHYSQPRNNDGPYKTVELGFPSKEDELITKYAECAEDTTGTVYPYMPIEIVVELIIKHGGFKK